jgi:hypothetical protein
MARTLQAYSLALHIEVEAREVTLVDPLAAEQPRLSSGKRTHHRIEPFWLFRVGSSETLALLSEAAERLATEVGVGADAVVRAILLGQPAAVRAWQMAHLPRAGVPFRTAVEIRDPQLSYQQVREIFGTLTRHGILTPSSSSADQRAKLERLYEFVVERRFRRLPLMTWNDVCCEWNAAYPDEHYSLRAIQRAFAASWQARGEAKPPQMRGQRRKPAKE